jgi:hypothetical protein
MRIKRNDRTVPRYTAVDTLNSEGIVTKSWGAATTISADFQPLNNKAILEHYGIDPGSGCHAFADNASIMPLGSVVKLAEGNFECIGIHPWYSHVECILRLSPVVLP